MLRRTKGRLLLTLLVITGLAGTIHDTALSKKERKVAITLMKDTKTEFLKSTKNLSKKQLDFRPAKDHLSIKEHIYQASFAENKFWHLLETAMKAPANPKMRSKITISDDDIIEMMNGSDECIEFLEMKDNKANSAKTIDEALAGFKNKRMDHIKYINISTEDLRNHVIQMPFGWIDCYQLCLVIAVQTHLHTQKINKLRADPHFPGNK